MKSAAAQLAASKAQWKDETFGHDGFPGESIGDLELRDGERGKPLVIGAEGVTWEPPEHFCAAKRPLGKRDDGTATWLYSDKDGDGYVSAVESMVRDHGNFRQFLAMFCWSFGSVWMMRGTGGDRCRAGVGRRLLLPLSARVRRGPPPAAV